MSIDSGFADGANLLNLRNLGINRTLTLVDGRRHVGGVQGVRRLILALFPSNWLSESKYSQAAHPQSMVQMR